jgi:hypothetical protein
MQIPAVNVLGKFSWPFIQICATLHIAMLFYERENGIDR